MIARQVLLGRAPCRNIVARSEAAKRQAYQALFIATACNTAPRRVMLLRHLTITGDVSKHHLATLSSMGSIRSGQLMRWAAGALVLLLVHALAAPRSAWAGCNHLVGLRSDASLQFDDLDGLIQGNPIARSSDDLARGSQGPNRDRPCSGMSCSGRFPMPVSTASHGSERSDQWGALATVAVVLCPSPSAGPSHEPGPRASGQATSIFHPPRA